MSKRTYQPNNRRRHKSTDSACACARGPGDQFFRRAAVRAGQNSAFRAHLLFTRSGFATRQR